MKKEIKKTYRGCDIYEEYSPPKTIKVSEKEFWALKNAIADRIDNLNSVADRTTTKPHKRCWIEQVHLLESIRDKLRY